MKTSQPISIFKKNCISLLVAGLLHFTGISQCIAPYSKVTYDTLITGSGNDHHSLSLSQFNPSIGTLMGVDISSVVSVNYGFTLKNTNTVPINFSIAVGRNDNFQSPVLSAEYSNSIMAPVGTFALNPNQTITQAPVPVINRYDNNIHLTDNLASFLGVGLVGFDYSPHTYTDHSGSSVYQYSASANDTIHFSVTYYYCSNVVVLTPALNAFNARKNSDFEAGLYWNIVNEQKDRSYEIEKGLDGLNFGVVGTVASTESMPESGYSFNYMADKNEKTLLYFRLKITAANGSISYSPIKTVDLADRPGGIYLYPNPSDQYINIVFNQPLVKKWRMDIYSSTGALLQTEFASSNIQTRINFSRKLPAGVYFIRLKDQDEMKTQTLRFSVR